MAEQLQVDPHHPSPLRLVRLAAHRAVHCVMALMLLLPGCGEGSSGVEEPEIPITPEANFTATPRSGLFPLTVTFDGSTSARFNGTIVSYDWEFGDGTTASGRVVSHEFTEPGLYTVSLTVTNNVGDTHTREQEDFIDANRTLWRFDVDKPVYYSAPAVGTDGTIYVSTGIVIHTNFGRVHAVNPDGSERWTATLDQNSPPPNGAVRAENNGSSPAIGPDGTVYVVDHRNVIYAFDPATGTRKWTVNRYESDFAWAVGQKTPAIADDGTLYVCIDYSLIALHPEDGRERWKREDLRGANPCATSASVSRDGIIYVASNDWFYAFNPDGTPHWPEPYQAPSIKEKSYSSPAIGADGTIYFGTETSAPFRGYFYALNPDGTLKWRYEVPGQRQVRASPAIGSDGTIYVTTKAYADPSDGIQPSFCLAFNPDGTLKWQYAVPVSNAFNPDDSYTSPAIGADGTIHFAAESGFVYALDASGALLWKENFGNTINWSSPILMDDGTLYIGGNRAENGGRLVAIRTTSLGLDNGPWPKFRGNAGNTGRGR